MRVRMKTLMCGPEGNHYPGDTPDFPEEQAKDLIKGGFAEKLGTASPSTGAKGKSGSRKSNEKTKQQELVPETDLEKLSRKKLLARAEEAGLDPDECKSMSRDDLILSIMEKQESGDKTDEDNHPEPDFDEMTDDELLDLAEKSGLDIDDAENMDKEELIAEIKKAIEEAEGDEDPGQ